MSYEFWIISGLCILLLLIIWVIYETIERKKTIEANKTIWMVVEKIQKSLSTKISKYISEVDTDLKSKIELIDFGKYINHFFNQILEDKKEDEVKNPRKGKDKKKVDRWDYFGNK